MLLTEKVEIVLTKRNCLKLRNKYDLDNPKIGDIITVNIKDITIGSKIVVDVKCDYCGLEFKQPYKRYNLSIKDINKSSCSRYQCSNQKIKDVCQSKYGVDNPFQLNTVKEKSKQTLIRNHGVEHQMYSDVVKSKIRNTCLEKYGLDSYAKTDDFKVKVTETNMLKYGSEYYIGTDDFIRRSKETNLKKYGVEYVSQSEEFQKKRRESSIEKWGVDSNLKSEDCKQIIRNTNIERYGYDNVFKSPEIREQIKKTNIEKYGVESPLQSPIILDKVRKTNLDKYNVEHVSQSDEIRIKFSITKHDSYITYVGNSVSLFKCDLDKPHNFEISTDLYFNRIRGRVPLCVICNPVGELYSIKEKQVLNYIKSIYQGEVIGSYRDGLEIDIYLPDLKIGFEFNGLYWHSEKYRDRNYHLNKRKYFLDKGIHIINIWEDDWSHRTNIIKSQIRNWIGITNTMIHARKCEVRVINDPKIVRCFLDENHIQGFVNSVVKIGLYYRGELVSIMTFDHSEGRKKMDNMEWNLSRFCNKIDTSVIGGASRLLKNFIKNYGPTRIVSYADRDWSNGKLYETIGFKLINFSNPDYKYVVDGKRVHKSRFRKSKLKTTLTESKYVEKNRINKIWDCGKIKFEMVLS